MARNLTSALKRYQRMEFDGSKWADVYSKDEYHRMLKELYIDATRCVDRDPLTHSLSEGMEYNRFHRESESGDYWCLYGFVRLDPEDVANATDDELAEWFEENMAVRIFSDYDCTGRAHTRYINFHRNPNGMVSFVHHMALDV